MHSLQSSTVPFGVDCSLHEQRGLPTIQWFCSVIIVFRPYPVYWHSFLFLLLNLTSLLFLPPLLSPPTLSIPAFFASTSRGHLDLGSWTFQSLKLLKHLQYFFFFPLVPFIESWRPKPRTNKKPYTIKICVERGEGRAVPGVQPHRVSLRGESWGPPFWWAPSPVFFGRILLILLKWKGPPKRFQGNSFTAVLWVNNASAASAKWGHPLTAAQDTSAHLQTSLLLPLFTHWCVLPYGFYCSI